jgi:hypothetical protein
MTPRKQTYKTEEAAKTRKEKARFAARKLDSVGTIKLHSGLLLNNNEEHLAKYQNKVTMAKSLARIETQDKTACCR